MRIRLFADFGSTFTKLVAIDAERASVAARVQVPSTVETDVTVGLEQAFEQMGRLLPLSDADRRATVACSSAAGGLRMVCVGLVPEYTTLAGRLAALGSGAKVVGEFSYALSRAEIEQIQALRPDILLLTGGTDGGNRKVILHNAAMLAEAKPDCRIVCAGNARCADEIAALFDRAGCRATVTDNVMPRLGELCLDPVCAVIRELFLHHIVQAKGIARANAMIGGVKMPTPSAVLEGAKLLSQGVPGVSYGMGELLLVDVGGATTDVCSVCDGRPTRDGVELRGMAEPYAKRTVEGDLGLYHNLDTLCALAREQDMEETDETEARLRANLSIPEGDLVSRQLALSRLAVRTAVRRHAGELITELTSHGLSVRQKGKDLSEIKTVVGCGGPIVFSADPGTVLGGAVWDESCGGSLLPKAPRFFIDGQYILFAVGLLAQSDPALALRTAMNSIREL